ncbi:glycosyltransferase [Vibrio sp. 10N.261.46.E12]|nr:MULTISPECIES: glycosyltransferase [unclassified Vibrio]PMJ26057.1 glycosyl transferase [Vibrio sp. 10N.286.45.B6]PML89630.1 glycosyl transferase [Vibrio sp. 10N.261.49.E11]PMM69702.1 glycosyl transferase [Vibrio sp. 10N.261.46.F12]PMM90700.1 glycosyl transferase [Vibrio sp. 10N.261.46.E8]PMN31146.1 glycosyl transferase [Vibrio sp. 10N.261.45.E2]
MKNKKFDASIVISFYNNTQALSCIIRALEYQNDNFEIIIADDGSKNDKVSEVLSIIKNSPLPIRHIWQSDNGFRKNRILNKAIKASRSDYIIFIDGDCTPQRHFVQDHIRNREIGVVLNGRRVDLASSFKDKLYEAPEPEIFFESNKLDIFSKYLLGHGKNVEKGIRITNSILSKKLNRKKKGIVGCNFSLYKKDLLSINGFDNRYEVPGVGEDSDIEYRLKKSGVRVKNIFYQAVILHLMHPELTRDKLAQELLNDTIEKQQIVALNGYLQADDVK